MVPILNLDHNWNDGQKQTQKYCCSMDVLESFGRFRLLVVEWEENSPEKPQSEEQSPDPNLNHSIVINNPYSYEESESLGSSQSIIISEAMCAHTIKGAVDTGGCKTVHKTPGAAEEFPFVSNSNQYHQDCHIMHVCL